MGREPVMNWEQTIQHAETYLCYYVKPDTSAADIKKAIAQIAYESIPVAKRENKQLLIGLLMESDTEPALVADYNLNAAYALLLTRLVDILHAYWEMELQPRSKGYN